jgi:PAS domain S-box-containing protein
VTSNLPESAATFVALAIVAFYVALRRERTGVHWLLLTLLGAILAWTGGLTVFWLADEAQVQRFAMMIVFLAVFTVPPCWLFLAVHHTHLRLFDVRPGWMIAVLVPSAMSALAVVTNAGHRLFVRDFDREGLAGAAVEWAGPLFWVGISVGILQLMIGAGLYLGVATRNFLDGQRRRGVGLAAIVVGPLVAGPLLSTLVARDVSPAMMGLMTLLLFVFNWRHRVLETLPIARKDVIGHLSEGVVLMNSDGWVLDVNPSAEHLLGSPAGELAGSVLSLVLRDRAVPEDAVAVEQALEALVVRGQSVMMEFEAEGERVLEVNASRVHGGDGETAGYYALLSDRTEQKRYEMFLRQSHRLETLASFSAGIAHEVNSPLAYVRSNLQHIQRIGAMLSDADGEAQALSSDELEELKQVTEESVEGVDRIGRTIDRMRRFSRLSEGELGPVDVNDVVRDALRMARMRSGTQLELETLLAEPIEVAHGSEEHLVQALLILLVNARQALAGRGGARLRIATRRSGNYVEIHVIDNGPGIPMDIQRQIFDPFFTTKAKGEGTGLGLSIAFGIVREHDGMLDLETGDGMGCDFVIRLPVRASRDSRIERLDLP